MAVLVEGISVIVRKDRIRRSFDGGWNGYVATIPNQTFCEDDEVTRVGFMRPDAVEAYINQLTACGLQFLVDGNCKDIAVADQQHGFTMPCDWLEVASVPFGPDGGRVSICWLFEGERVASGLHMRSLKMELHVPKGWEFSGSLSENFKFATRPEAAERLRFLRRDNDIDVYLDTDSGNEVFIAPKS